MLYTVKYGSGRFMSSKSLYEYCFTPFTFGVARGIGGVAKEISGVATETFGVSRKSSRLCTTGVCSAFAEVVSALCHSNARSSVRTPCS